MSVVEAMILGVVQGLTEFLPVSSSGHLVLMRAIMDVGEVPILFDVLLHVATLLVVLIVFRKVIARILGALLHSVTGRRRSDDLHYLRLALLVIAATVVTGAMGFGYSLLDIPENPRMTSILFLVTAAVLVAVRFLSPQRDYADFSPARAAGVGFFQGLGVLAGISRSGITIAGGLILGLKREQAGEFAFLISIPAVLGALVLTLGGAEDLSRLLSPAALIGGIAASFLVGLGALSLLLYLVKAGKLWLFAFYLLPLGILGLIFL